MVALPYTSTPGIGNVQKTRFLVIRIITFHRFHSYAELDCLQGIQEK